MTVGHDAACRMQALSGLGTPEANEETIAATLRLKGIGDEEAQRQADTYTALMYVTWEPAQVVSSRQLRLLGMTCRLACRRAQRW